MLSRHVCFYGVGFIYFSVGYASQGTHGTGDRRLGGNKSGFSSLPDRTMGKGTRSYLGFLSTMTGGLHKNRY